MIVVKGQLMNDSTISIYDVQGRIVMFKSLDNNSNTNTIDVSNFNTGIYIVQIKNNTLSKTQKIIIK